MDNMKRFDYSDIKRQVKSGLEGWLILPDIEGFPIGLVSFWFMNIVFFFNYLNMDVGNYTFLLSACKCLMITYSIVYGFTWLMLIIKGYEDIKKTFPKMPIVHRNSSISTVIRYSVTTVHCLLAYQVFPKLTVCYIIVTALLQIQVISLCNKYTQEVNSMFE